MSNISPITKRYVALGILIAISGSLLGVSIYQTYFVNPVDELYYLGEVDHFEMNSTQSTNFQFDPTTHDATVVSFIYTKCPGDAGCSLLSSNLAELESMVQEEGWKDSIQFVSIDFDYRNDDMDDLRSYAKTYTDDFAFWHFLLGNENQTNEVAEEFGFYFEPNPEYDSDLHPSHGGVDDVDPYIHAMITYIIDREGNMRKLITGTVWDFELTMNVLEFLQSSDWQNSP